MSPEAPQVDDSTERWWRALGEGQLLVPRCDACGRLHLYPRRFCPYCWGTALTWEQASGRGSVYTFSTIYVNDLGAFGAEVPYTVAVVELDEGPRLEARLVGCPPEEVVIGMPVELVVERGDDRVSVPTFGPAGRGT